MTSASVFSPATLEPILKEISNLLRARGETVSVVETAAGGLISASLLSTPGASHYYKGGMTLYTLPSRVSYAGWTQQDIDSYRGPTQDIALNLAKHIRQELKSTWTVAESGTAGPTGGNTPNRTPGFLALAVDSDHVSAGQELNTGLGGDRLANMNAFAYNALEMLRDCIKKQAERERQSAKSQTNV